ncbi:MAG: insulinase family protein [Clostridium sp.]|nr:insulinase family protein [Clostridium sp.]
MNKYSGLILRPSGEFRKNSACISLVIDKDKTSYEALLALSVMLKVSSNAYKDERGYKLRLMNLYSSTVSFGAVRYGNKYLFNILLECPLDKFIESSFSSLESKVFKTYKDLIYKGFAHDEAKLMLVKGRMIRDNGDTTANPFFMTLEGLRKNFFPEATFGYPPCGDNTRIMSLTFDDLEKALEAVRKADAYIGSVGFQKKGREFGKLFSIGEKAPEWKFDISVEDKVSDLSLIKDGITSSCIAIGYQIEAEQGNKGHALKNILSKVLSDDNSPLFQGLREEKGLTYGVDVSFPKGDKAMIVSSVIDAKNVDEFIKTTDKLLSTCAESITQERLDDIKKAIKTSIDDMFGEPTTYALALNKSVLNQSPSTADELMKLYDSITLDDVKDAIKSLKKVGSFTVNPSKEN